MPRVMQSPRHEGVLKLKLQRLLHKGFITFRTLILLYQGLIHLFPQFKYSFCSITCNDGHKLKRRLKRQDIIPSEMTTLP